MIRKIIPNVGEPNGGERGIRTLDTLVGYTHFPGVRLRPLGHLSLFKEFQNFMCVVHFSEC